MDNKFQHIWNQLVLLTQFELYGDIHEMFETVINQIRKAYADQQLEPNQYIILLNAALEWRDILAQQSAEKAGKEES